MVRNRLSINFEYNLHKYSCYQYPRAFEEASSIYKDIAFFVFERIQHPNKNNKIRYFKKDFYKA